MTNGDLTRKIILICKKYKNPRDAEGEIENLLDAERPQTDEQAQTGRKPPTVPTLPPSPRTCGHFGRGGSFPSKPE
jgi:hypothetical protein